MSAIYKNGVQYVGITDAANMSVDVGQNTLNLKDTVQNLINNFAPIETNPSANQHSVGDLITYNSTLYKVTDDIDDGDTLVIGTNIVETSFNEYIEDTESKSFIYAESLESLYNQIEEIPFRHVKLFDVSGDVASALTNGQVTSFYKGFVANMDNTEHIYDFVGLDGIGYLFGQRIRFDTPTTPVIQLKESFARVNSLSLKTINFTCQNASHNDRLVTQNVALQDGLSDYDIVQLVGATNGIRSLARKRSDGNYITLWDTNYSPKLTGGTAIPANSNLNNYTTVGTYHCSQSADAITLVNRPQGMDVAFIMYVKHATGGNASYPAQTIYEYNSAKTYYRVKTGDTWSGWMTPVQHITGAASSIARNNLTANMALVSSSAGKVATHGTVSATELGYLDGVTSAIQTQINGKAPTSHASSATTYGIGTGSNYGHVKLSDTYDSTVANNAAANGMGASQKALYTAYNALSTSKQNNITGGASSITTSNLTTSRVLISSTAGKVAVSSITPTQLGYLNGVTSAIQTQLNAKQATLAWSYYAQNAVSSVTCTTANLYYKAGANGVTFPAGKYIVIAHFQTAVTSTDKTPLITGAIGPTASDTGNSLRRVTIKQQVSSGGYYFGKIVDFIQFNSQTTYYAWISSSLSNTIVNSGCWIDAIKFA